MAGNGSPWGPGCQGWSSGVTLGILARLGLGGQTSQPPTHPRGLVRNAAVSVGQVPWGSSSVSDPEAA